MQAERLPRPCPVCGEIFEPHKSGRTWTKSCSRECANELIARAMRAGGARKANAAVKHPARVWMKCEECGREWDLPPSQVKGRRTCSLECANGLKRREAYQSATRQGPDNPNYKHGRRSGVRSRQAEREWRSALAKKCSHPGCTGEAGKLVLHHVVYEQHVKREGGNRFDPRNAMTLCPSCHSSHHHRSRPIPLVTVSDASIEFAIELFGGNEFKAALYLKRRYSGSDPRIARRLVL